MKVYLMYRDRDFDLTQEQPPHANEVIQDLELRSLFAAMVRGDKVLADVVSKAVLASTTDIDTIRYRQAILNDCLEREAIVREIYDLAVETIEAQRKSFYLSGGRYPAGILHSSISILEMLVVKLRRLRTIADQQLSTFSSEGFRTLFAMLHTELSDEYFETISRHLRQLKFKRGVLVSARLGVGNKGANYVLRKDPTPEGNWLTWLRALIRSLLNGLQHGLDTVLGKNGRDQRSWLTSWFGPSPEPAYSFELAPQDDGGARALSQLNDRGLNLVANALAQSTDHVLSFFTVLRTELAFYVGCLNLRDQLARGGEAICFPRPAPTTERRYSAVGLYDVCLALNIGRRVVGNDLAADGKDLVIITGANQGGKSTFLRSLGLAQIMMQCGMFVPATAFEANVCERIFTHYKREEDAAMNSGKFDEELSRMSDIVNDLTPNSLVLFNESFAATNEREGSEIARQVVTALVERDIKIVFVTHQYDFAHGIEASNLHNVLFLRAERHDDGARTFKIVEGEPLETSYGADLYERIFIEAVTP